MKPVITGLGMVTSVGYDAVTSCAAIRAGITHPCEIPDCDLLDDELEPVSLVGHAIVAYTEGYYLLARWLRMASGCLSDLVAYGRLPGRPEAAFWRRTGLIAVTPVIDQRFELAEQPTVDVVKDLYVSRLLALADMPISNERLDAVCMGSSGVMEALKRSQRLLESSTLERVIVLAVDSYLEPMSLNWLKEQRRLKTPENPVGLQPAEAGACFMVESPASSRTRGAKAEATVESVAIAFEEQNLFSDTPSSGTALHRVLDSVLTESGIAEPFCGDCVADLNGEGWRASELANARLRLKGKLSSSVRFVLPCESIGDTGAAAAAIGVCVAVRSLARGYSSGRTVLLTSSTEHGHVGAALLSQWSL